MNLPIKGMDFFDLFDKYFEETVLAISDKSISELSRQMAAYFLIEDAFLKLANEKELDDWYELNPTKSSSIHLFSDVLEQFYISYKNKVEIIFVPGEKIPNDWQARLKASLLELQSKGHLKILKSHDWADYNIELTSKLKKYQTIPYLFIQL